jgi:hypothetical protein
VVYNAARMEIHLEELQDLALGEKTRKREKE